jgi:hypothetical protein
MMAWVAVSITYFPETFFLSVFTEKQKLTLVLDGFFDAGMLLHALKGVSAERERGDKPAKRKFVGKKLHLNEY